MKLAARITTAFATAAMLAAFAAPAFADDDTPVYAPPPIDYSTPAMPTTAPPPAPSNLPDLSSGLPVGGGYSINGSLSNPAPHVTVTTHF